MPAPRNRFRAFAKVVMGFSSVIVLVMTIGITAPEAKAQDNAGDYGEAAQSASLLQCTFGWNSTMSAVYIGPVAASTRDCHYIDIIKARIAEARGSLQFIVVRALLSVMQNLVIGFSQQMANWALSGFHGKPAFWTMTFKDMAQSLTLQVVNRFIDEADKSWGLGLCQKPTLGMKLALGLNMPGMVPPPNCTLQTIVSNYEQVYHSLTPRQVATSLLNSVQVGGNALDVNLRAQSLLASRIAQELSGSDYDRAETAGMKIVPKSPLSTKIKTPALIVNQTLAESNVVKTTNAVSVSEMNTLALSAMWTGIKQLPLVAGMTVLTVVANALLQKALMALMAPNGDDTSVEAIDLTNPFGETANEPQKPSALSRAFTDIISPNLISQDMLDIVTEMSACTDPRGYWNCTMDDGLAAAFRAANDAGAATVVRATGVGGGTQYLHPDWELIPVTDAKDDQDPGCYQRAYCASNLAKMRFARMLPIGWELAANSPFNVKTNGRYVTLGEVLANFNNCNASNTLDADHKWCHLIDPSWVLAAVPFKCQLKGYGDTLQVPNIAMRLQECSDPVSCLKRDDKGVCIGGYGYCLSDKTVWRFGADACDEKYVSCRTYTSRAEGVHQGADLSYLRNTLDYGACNQDNIGCMFYATLHDVSTTSTGKWVSNMGWLNNGSVKKGGVTLDTSGTIGTPRIYFDSTAVPCDASADGCTAVDHVVAGQPALNLVRNGSFENNISDQSDFLDGWFDWVKSAPVKSVPFTSASDITTSHSGDTAYWYTGANATYSYQTVSVAPTRNYVLSFYAKADETSSPHQASVTAVFYDKSGNLVSHNTDYYRSTQDCNDVYAFGQPVPTPGYKASLVSANVGADTLPAEWQRYTCEFLSNVDVAQAKIVVGGKSAVIDDIQLEEGDAATDFVDGLSSSLKSDYLKLAPEEFGCTGATTDRKECADYAQVCRQTEAGCQGYTQVGGGDQTEIPAIISVNDACPNTCVGYAEYRKLATAFDLVATGGAVSDPLNDPNDDSKGTFVPKAAQTCSADQPAARASPTSKRRLRAASRRSI